MSGTRTTRRDLLQAGAILAAGTLCGTSRTSLADDAAESSPKLKITSVKTFLLEYKLKQPFGVSVSVPLDRTRTALLVKIETDAGLVGWGETVPVAGARGTIEEQIAPALVGRSPLEHRKLWREIWGANFGNGLAVGAVDTALLDLRGKALNLPVAELFGGRLRDRVPAYASAMNYLEGKKPEDHYVSEARELVAKGYKALKMRLGRFQVAREAKIAASVREAVGPDIRLLVDGNGAYTLATALQMGEELHRLGFEAFEEPLPQSPNYAGYEALREKLPLSLAGGEVLDSRGNAKALIDRRTFDIIQPDVSLCGGIGEVLFIAELAALSGIRCIPHCWCGAILIAATTHLLSLLPDPHWGLPTDTPWIELDQSENPWRMEIVVEPVRFDKGDVVVPTKPGLGVEINEEAVRKYAI